MKILFFILIVLIIIYFFLKSRNVDIEGFTDRYNIPDDLYDKQMVDIYDIVWNNPSFYKNVRLEHGYFDKGKSILDAGCGLGHSTNYYRELGMNVLGLDKSKQMLNKASVINPKNKIFKRRFGKFRII